MSVRDICELGALLNAEDSDRENLECELGLVFKKSNFYMLGI